MTMLGQTLLDEISKKHKEGVTLDAQLRETLLAKLETTRQCGVLLDEAHDQFRNGEWKQFCSELPFDGQAIKAFLRFARKNPSPIVDLRKAFHCAVDAAMATGLIEFPKGFAGPQKLHEPNFFSRLTIAIQTLAADWKKYVSRQPLSKWSDETKEQFLHSLKPIFRIHREVMASIKHGKS